MRNQVLLQIPEQFGIGGWIGRAQIVRRFDDAAAQQPVPDAVDDIRGEVGIVGSGQPLGQLPARILLRGELQRLAARHLRLHYQPCARVAQAELEVRVDHFLFPLARILEIDAGEIGAEAQIVFRRPAFQRMAVAAGAADARAHEDQGRGLAQRARILVRHGADEVCRSYLEVAAGGGE